MTIVSIGHHDATNHQDDASIASGSLRSGSSSKRVIREGEGVGDISFELKNKVYISLIPSDKASFKLQHKKLNIIFKVCINDLARAMSSNLFVVF